MIEAILALLASLCISMAVWSVCAETKAAKLRERLATARLELEQHKRECESCLHRRIHNL